MDSTTTRQAIDGLTVVTVVCGRMVAYRSELGERVGQWTVKVGRKPTVRASCAANVRMETAFLRRRQYAQALRRVELGKA